MQQFAIQLYVDCHQHGAGSLFSSILLAESFSRTDRHSAFDCEEWTSNLHDRNAGGPRRSWISARKLAPAGRHSLFLVGASCSALIAVAIAPQRERSI